RPLFLRLLDELGELDVLAAERWCRGTVTACEGSCRCEDREPCGCGDRPAEHRAPAHSLLSDQACDHRVPPVEVVLLKCTLQDLVNLPMLPHGCPPGRNVNSQRTAARSTIQGAVVVSSRVWHRIGSVPSQRRPGGGPAAP